MIDTKSQTKSSASAVDQNDVFDSTAKLCQSLEVDITKGLSSEQASARLLEYGPNAVKVKAKTSAFVLLLRQFQSSVVILLIVASLISFVSQDNLQGIGILIAVFINAFVGFATEYKAQISLEALEKITGPTSRVLRDGEDFVIASSELVPGDIVFLEPGTRIPCDLRIFEASKLSVDESVLTGESIPVNKSSSFVEGEEKSIVFAKHGTHVVEGRGRGIAIKTGLDTSLGKLQASLIEGHSRMTPLEEKLDILGKQLSWMTVVICLLIALIGLLYKHDIWTMLESGIALAVAAIPEGLPVVATLALAIGTQRMVDIGALVRQIHAVETLGCTTVICSDKTGTLTKNELSVTDMFVDDKSIEVTGSGYNPEGSFKLESEEIDPSTIPTLSSLLESVMLCNDASLTCEPDTNEWKVAGDPTEGALIALARKGGFQLDQLSKEKPRVDEIPFDLESKKMTTLNSCGKDKAFAFIKGSPEKLICDLDKIATENGVIDFTSNLKNKYLAKNDLYASQGLRVLGVASAEIETCDTTELSELDYEPAFLGLVAMRDLPRANVNEAIQECKKAGIKVVMLTGDQSATASRVASDLSIIDSKQDDVVISGEELGDLDEASFARKLSNAKVLARVTPSIKLEAVRALQAQGHVVAMTGDGVNDAPALKQADIGIAMGGSGTDLAREASKMVITDDNFSTIVMAIERGRVIYDNIKRSICYLLTAAIASVITVAFVMIYDGTLAMTPLQLLWLNLIMHIFPGLGIVLQGKAPGVMELPPRDPKDNFLNKFEIKQILVQSLSVSLMVLASIEFYRHFIGKPESITTIAFTTIALALLYQAWIWLFISNPEDKSSKTANVNRFMYLMMAISYALIPVAIYVPEFQFALKTQALNLTEFGLAFIFATVSVILYLCLYFVDRFFQMAYKRSEVK